MDEAVKVFAAGYDAALIRYRAKLAAGVVAESVAYAEFLTDLGYTVAEARRLDAARHA